MDNANQQKPCLVLVVYSVTEVKYRHTDVDNTQVIISNTCDGMLVDTPIMHHGLCSLMQRGDIFTSLSWSNTKQRKSVFSARRLFPFIPADARRLAAGFTGSCSPLSSYCSSGRQRHQSWFLGPRSRSRRRVNSFKLVSCHQGQMAWKPFTSTLRKDTGPAPVSD